MRRGARETWTPFSEMYDPDAILRSPEGWPEPGPYGPEVNLEITNVLMLRNGRIVYQEFFWDHAKALEAVGLSE